MTEPPFDLEKAHRWFAVELNNMAWELVENSRRSHEETERMIHVAHASVYHWLRAGTMLNHLRGQCLLATAYAAAGLVEPALRHAARCAELGARIDEQTPFDRATLHGCQSNALALAGRIPEARLQYALAVEAAGQFEHADDRPVFDKLYPPP